MYKWRTEQLRLTVFPSLAEDIDPKDIWDQIINVEMENINEKPREGKILIRGKHSLGHFILEKSPDRIHIRLLAPEDAEQLASEIPSIGDFPESVEPFRGLVVDWLTRKDILDLNRIAFGAVLLIDVESRQEGYILLNKLLPFVELDYNSSDFLYQINRPRQINIQDSTIDLNRLSKWNVVNLLGSLFHFTPKEISQESKELYTAARLELDISTDKNHEGYLDANILNDLFDQMVNIGVEISQEGDIK